MYARAMTNNTTTHTGLAPADRTYARITANRHSDTLTIWTAWVYTEGRKRYYSFDTYTERAIRTKLKNLGITDIETA